MTTTTKDLLQKTKEQKLYEIRQRGCLGHLGRTVYIEDKTFTYDQVVEIAEYIGEQLDAVVHLGAPIHIVGDFYLKRCYSLRAVPEATHVPGFVFVLLS